MFEKLFKLQNNNTSIRTEIMAGLATFLTMAYIIFVNPGILSTDFSGNPTGLSFDAVMMATCLATFIASVIMGLLANMPIAQAPGMGENFFFVTVLMALSAAGITDSWKSSMTIVLIAGVLFLILSLLKFRKAIMNAISPSMKNAIAVGIGLFIAFIGMKNAGIIVDTPPGSLVALTHNIAQPHVVIFFAGLLFMAILQARRIKGAILWGILFSTLLALVWGKIRYAGVFGYPKSHAFFQFDFSHILRTDIILFIVVFLFMDMFDTVGTLIGVGEQAGFIKGNEFPNADRAFVSDAVGTIVGACSGTSTVTSYIESCVGVESGGRTGLTAVTTGILFLAALFFTPLVSMIGGGWEIQNWIGNGVVTERVNPITAPALVIVGSMMVRNVKNIDWHDITEGFPAFLIMLGIPLSFNIADGLAMGIVAYPVIKLCTGRRREISWLVILIAVIFILRYVFDPTLIK
jgi:AGZA family xanthine/uracil permease-like MFS transporter